MKNLFTIWTMEGCATCDNVATDLRKYGGIEFKDLAELKRNPPKTTNGDCIEIQVLSQLSYQNEKAPVVVMNGCVLTEGEVDKVRKVAV